MMMSRQTGRCHAYTSTPARLPPNRPLRTMHPRPTVCAGHELLLRFEVVWGEAGGGDAAEERRGGLGVGHVHPVNGALQGGAHETKGALDASLQPGHQPPPPQQPGTQLRPAAGLPLQPHPRRPRPHLPTSLSSPPSSSQALKEPQPDHPPTQPDHPPNLTTHPPTHRLGVGSE